MLTVGVQNYHKNKNYGNVTSLHSSYNPYFKSKQVDDKVVFDIYSRAKNLCLSTVNTSSPIESACIIDLKNNNLVKFVNGTMTDITNIRLPFSLFDKNRYSIVHSHPTLKDNQNNRYTLPISFADFLFLNSHKNMKEIVAIDSKGSETTLRKMPKFTQLDDKEINTFRNNFLEFLYDNLCDEPEKDHITKLYNYTKKNPNSTAIKQNIVNKILDKQYDSKAVDTIKEFWRKFAEQYNLEFIEG